MLKREAPMVDVAEEEAVEFLSGVVDGLIQEDHFENIQKCLADDKEVATQVSIALTDFKKQNLRGVLAGIKVIGDLLPSIPTDAEECRAVKSDFARIGKWASILKNPFSLVKTVGKNLRKNYVAVLQDVATEAKDFANGDSRGAGEIVADIMIQALGPVPAAKKDTSYVNQIDEIDIDSFAQGNLTSEEILAALMAQNNQKKATKKNKRVMLMLI